MLRPCFAIYVYFVRLPETLEMDTYSLILNVMYYFYRTFKFTLNFLLLHMSAINHSWIMATLLCWNDL